MLTPLWEAVPAALLLASALLFFLNICICIYIKQPWLCCGLPMACIPAVCLWAPCNTQELLGKGLKCPQFVSSGSPKPRRGWFQPGLPRRALQRCWVPFPCRNQGCPASHGGPAPTGQHGRPTCPPCQGQQHLPAPQLPGRKHRDALNDKGTLWHRHHPPPAP